jgi:hypothetical protein
MIKIDLTRDAEALVTAFMDAVGNSLACLLFR